MISAHEVSGVGLHFSLLSLLVEKLNREVLLLYYPPYHSKYNPTLALLGHFGKALEWGQTDRCTHHAPVGKKYDLERPSSDCEVEPQDL